MKSWMVNFGFPDLREAGGIIARAVPDGPDGDFENARWTLLAALAETQTSVKILTPYFLPDATIITALNLAALRGVQVDISCRPKAICPMSIGRRGRCGGRCWNAAAASGSRPRRLTIPS